MKNCEFVVMKSRPRIRPRAAGYNYKNSFYRVECIYKYHSLCSKLIATQSWLAVPGSKTGKSAFRRDASFFFFVPHLPPTRPDGHGGRSYFFTFNIHNGIVVWIPEFRNSLNICANVPSFLNGLKWLPLNNLAMILSVRRPTLGVTRRRRQL